MVGRGEGVRGLRPCFNLMLFITLSNRNQFSKVLDWRFQRSLKLFDEVEDGFKGGTEQTGSEESGADSHHSK